MAVPTQGRHGDACHSRSPRCNSIATIRRPLLLGAVMAYDRSCNNLCVDKDELSRPSCHRCRPGRSHNSKEEQRTRESRGMGMSGARTLLFRFPDADGRWIAWLPSLRGRQGSSKGAREPRERHKSKRGEIRTWVDWRIALTFWSSAAMCVLPVGAPGPCPPGERAPVGVWPPGGVEVGVLRSCTLPLLIISSISAHSSRTNSMMHQSENVAGTRTISEAGALPAEGGQ